MKIDVVEMFTSEIAVVEINTLREEGLTLVLPSDLKVDLITQTEGLTYIHIFREE